MRLASVLVLLFSALVIAQNQQAPENAPVAAPQVEISVTVTAEQSRQMQAAVKSLSSNDDRFVAALAGHTVTLGEALAQSARIYAVGPLTDRERAVVGLSDYLAAHQASGGTIRLQVRTSWTEMDPAIYAFNPATFLQLLADLGKGPTVQVPTLQREQELFLGRMLLDLNQQSDDTIPQRIVLEALGSVFKEKHVGARFVEAAQAMADSGTLYDFVPAARLKDFERLAGPDFFIPTAVSRPDTVKIAYGEATYSMKVDQFVWACLRLFSGDNSDDWAMQAKARDRSALGRDIIDHLEAQIRENAIDHALTQLPPAAEENVLLGTYRGEGLVANLLEDAPGMIRKKFAQDPSMVVLSVQAKKLEVFRGWLTAKRAILGAQHAAGNRRSHAGTAENAGGGGKPESVQPFRRFSALS